MEYPLLYRWQGALFGSQISNPPTNDLEQATLRKIEDFNLVLIDNLISYRELNIEKLENNGIYQILIREISQENCFAVNALAFLPLALFYHDNLGLMSEKITALLISYPDSSGMSKDIIVWSKLIALIVAEKLQVNQLADCFIAAQGKTQPRLVKILSVISTCRAQRKSVQELVEYLTSLSLDESFKSMAIALYCFITTPANFALSWQRAITINEPRARIIAALVGVLSGAYNSWLNLPLAWRYANKALPGKLDHKLRELLAIWSGVYQIKPYQLSPEFITASTQVIQPRSTLKIISQANNQCLLDD